MTHETPKQLIDALGGYRIVADRLGLGSTTLHTHIRAAKIPSKLYRAICALAVEAAVTEPDMSLFSFAELPRVKTSSTKSEGRAA